jgi:glycerol-3-phosphate dehydrogenase (NAD(P)+)
MKTIALLGAGSWGTAVAIHLANSGNRVLLWAHDPQHIKEMIEKGCNSRYLPSDPFPDTLQPMANLEECIEKADFVLIAVPSHAFLEVLLQIKKPLQGIAWLTKGLEPKTHQLFSEIIEQRWGKNYPIAIISGPSFANEVAKGLPTALTLAGNNLSYQKALQSVLHYGNLRVYLSNDVIGVQLCGAIKNVLAIACGISDGLGYGANAKAALITRGLAEMSRLGKALGAKEETFIGLAGVGDLVLTCTDNQSRNRRFGLLLGQGKNIQVAEQEIGQVVEGKNNATQVIALAQNQQIEMPICAQVAALLDEKISATQAVLNLMNRSAREE